MHQDTRMTADAFLQQMTQHISPDWLPHVRSEWEKGYFHKLLAFLIEESVSKKIFPPPEDIFRALRTPPYKNIRAVIVGQDPYHGVGQANGLCFAVNKGTPIPPSLRNILNEWSADVQLSLPVHGDLVPWTKSGVCLLNAVWTVPQGNPQGHRRQGWEMWTAHLLRVLNAHPQTLVFLLWGKQAQQWRQHLDETRHGVLETTHPSPLSAYRGFLGSRPFTQANAWLEARGMPPIDWTL